MAVSSFLWRFAQFPIAEKKNTIRHVEFAVCMIVLLMQILEIYRWAAMYTPCLLFQTPLLQLWGRFVSLTWRRVPRSTKRCSSERACKTLSSRIWVNSCVSGNLGCWLEPRTSEIVDYCQCLLWTATHIVRRHSELNLTRSISVACPCRTRWKTDRCFTFISIWLIACSYFGERP